MSELVSIILLVQSPDLIEVRNLVISILDARGTQKDVGSNPTLAHSYIQIKQVTQRN